MLRRLVTFLFYIMPFANGYKYLQIDFISYKINVRFTLQLSVVCIA